MHIKVQLNGFASNPKRSFFCLLFLNLQDALVDRFAGGVLKKGQGRQINNTLSREAQQPNRKTFYL